jgi:hypothetical protein
MKAMSKHARLTAARALVKENPVLLVIAAIGFSVSFQTIARLARAQHMPGWPVLYPLLIDAGILGFVIEARKAIDDNRSDLVPRLLAWALAGFTIYVNAHGSPAGDWVGITLHIAAPALWVAFLELTRWRKLRKVAALRADRIPRARWLIAFRRTAGMRKRMVLHNIVSYPEAVAREEARMLGMDLAAAVFGKRWKRDAPALLRHHLTAGTLPADVAVAAAEGSRDLAGKVEAWVTGTAVQRDKAAARVRQETSATDAPQPASPRAPRQRARKGRNPTAAERARNSATARQLLTDEPKMPRRDVVALSGVSERTADRIRSELAAARPSLSAVR